MYFSTLHLYYENGSSFIELNPTYELTESILKNTKTNRSIGGKLNTYKCKADGYRYSIPLTWVSSSTKFVIDELWLDNSEFIITYNLSSDPYSSKVKIVNITEPLNTFSKLSFTQGTPALFNEASYNGNIFLLTTNGIGQVTGGPFILGDSFWGVLGQSYNVLL